MGNRVLVPSMCMDKKFFSEILMSEIWSSRSPLPLAAHVKINEKMSSSIHPPFFFFSISSSFSSSTSFSFSSFLPQIFYFDFTFQKSNLKRREKVISFWNICERQILPIFFLFFSSSFFSPHGFIIIFLCLLSRIESYVPALIMCLDKQCGQAVWTSSLNKQSRSRIHPIDRCHISRSSCRSSIAI